MTDMHVRAVGPAGLLLDCADSTEADGWYAALRKAREQDELRCADLVPAATTVLIAGLPERAAGPVTDWLASGAIVPAASSQTGVGAVVTLRVRYDGPDLDDVAQHWEVSAAEAIRRHTSLPHRVQFCGFAPGFSYLAGLPEAWRVPRRDQPRPSVPAGAVGLAATWTGIYPRASPGGWQLIGTLLGTQLFDPDRDPPVLLPPGTQVRFVADTGP